MSGINEQVINAEIYQIGPQGIPGEAATISVGTVTTGEPGTDASVTNSGTSSAAILDFVIPQGEQGLQGIQGPQGIQGLTGATGNGISSIEKITTVGLTDTYRITFTNNTYYDFEVINGSSISDIEKTNTSGLVDTYTITLTNGNTHTFTVTNGAKGDKGETGEVGNGILGVNKMSTTGLVDNYRMTFTNGTYFDFDVTNAKSIVSISKISTSGLIDTYRITFNDNTNFQFPVTNGRGITGVTLLSWEGLEKTYRMSFNDGSHFDFVVTNGAGSQVDWGGIYGVLSQQTDLQDALVQSNGLTTGSVSTYNVMLKELIERAHSTFDLSKFTVVGSPNITNDGIYTSNLAFNTLTNGFTLPVKWGDLKGKSWNIKFRAYGDGTNTNSNPFGYQIYNTNDKFRVEWQRLYWYFRVGDSSDNKDNMYSVMAFPSAAGMYDAILSFNINTKTYSYKLINVETGEVYNSSTYTATETTSPELYRINQAPNAYITWYSFAPNTRMDFKHFSITADGVEVFSGNKTGIDTIKPDDYSIIGNSSSAIITDDGILKQSYATTTPNGFPVWDSSVLPTPDGKHIYRFEQKWSVNNNTVINFFMCLCLTPQTGVFAINSRADKYIYLSVFDGSQNAAIKTSKRINVNTIYNTVIETDFTTFLRCLCDGENIYENMNFAFPEGYAFRNIASFSCYYAGPSNFNYDFSGEHDLNAFKVYVDGNLVYQPCLKIPYTESKTGSKIVNSIYRDRVNDMASQFGYANYYTLDEDNENFTLPQVELPGLIGNKTLRDSYYNGVTYWELYSNRRLEQGGSCESGVEYTFPKPFADTNYILTIPYSSKTETSFIPSATGDFIAKGTGLL